ncbi:hypothetical protein ABZS81_30280 [Streptomyces sp. NPDC005318]|uniref:hypothetical protein n=1 Tax=Streptomyces sp. NPDC005318 TaxID=3157031 RepID=UPI0033A60374
MPQDRDHHSDPAAASVSLAAEAALLEARLRMLQEALGTVDARIEAVSEELRRLHGSTSSARAEEQADDQEFHGRNSAVPHVDDAGLGWLDTSPSCHP